MCYYLNYGEALENFGINCSLKLKVRTENKFQKSNVTIYLDLTIKNQNLSVSYRSSFLCILFRTACTEKIDLLSYILGVVNFSNLIFSDCTSISASSAKFYFCHKRTGVFQKLESDVSSWSHPS